MNLIEQLVRSARKGSDMAKKITVGTKLVTEEARLLRWWATKTHRSLSVFIRDTLLEAVPAKARETIQKAEGHQEAIDAAFAELDSLLTGSGIRIHRKTP